MRYYIYNTVTGLIVGGPLPNETDAIRIAGNQPDQDTLDSVDRVDRDLWRVDLASPPDLRAWTAQEITDRETEEDAVAARPATAESRLKGFMSLPAIQSIKTLIDAEDFIDTQVTDLDTAKDAMAKLLYAITNIVRVLDPTDDDYFPPDE